MTTKAGIVAALVVGMGWLPLVAPGLGSAPAFGSAAGLGAAPDAADSSPFANGTRAINESRWADAVKIFTEVAKRMANMPMGRSTGRPTRRTSWARSSRRRHACAELRKDYPKSRWIEDCGALEVEVRAGTGKPVEIEPGQSDDVKLLALNAMMRQDEPRALAEIQAILNGDSSERLKKEAQFILGQHYSNATYAQIVRISYVEGDVRIQRGARERKDRRRELGASGRRSAGGNWVQPGDWRGPRGDRV